MENGILVAPNNTSELREKIFYLLDNPEEVERFGRNAKRTVEQYFNIRSFASSIGNYIKETQWH
jgi:glycosyltransferase involved in cell wall biosynthesis